MTTITLLPALTVPESGDELPIVDASEPIVEQRTKRITYANLVAKLPKADGWIPVSDTWTYASPNTITVPSGAGSIYSVGMGLKLKHNGTQKWLYITKVENTLLTHAGGSDYTLPSSGSNTLSEISYTPTPQTAVGFPVWFNWTPVWTLSGSTLTTTYTTQIGKFAMSGRVVTATFKMVLGTVSVATADRAFVIVPPVAIQNTGSELAIGMVIYKDNGLEFIQSIAVGFSTSEIRFMACLPSVGDFLGAAPLKTLATGDSLMGTVVYEA